ncbi:MAG: F0F1 ATP synthase subunit epsilon [Bryobacteraceae bacterium]
MAETFELELATPERLIMREPVSELELPTKNGYIGVLPGHAAMLAELATGHLNYVSQGRTHYMAVNAGFVEVLPDRVRVLATTAERAGEIDVKRAEEALRKAQERLSAGANVGVDIARALSAMYRAQARIEVAQAAGRK